MENASKALMMAAGVLLGILLLSVMIYVFSQGARVSQMYDQKQITNQLELYNSRFEKFDRDNNTIMDAISLVNLAFDVNKDTDFDSTNAVEVIIDFGIKEYKFPNTNEKNMQRNEILLNNTKKSIYELTELTLLELGLENSIDGMGYAADKLTTTRFDREKNKTIYKFLFKVEDSEDFQYHMENMKVSKVVLTAYYNKDEWEGITPGT